MGGLRVSGRRYRRLAKGFAPRRQAVTHAGRAFVVGGAICAFGQLVWFGFAAGGLPPTQTAAATAGFMVAVGALFTALGAYDELGRWAGMGAQLPITGFANSVVAPAMEYRREGLVMGVGARMFQVAGPVIVFGTLAGIAGGLLHIWLGRV